jgi:hypothetical protein
MCTGDWAQVVLFRTVGCVVAAHGGALVNLLWMKAGR